MKVYENITYIHIPYIIEVPNQNFSLTRLHGIIGVGFRNLFCNSFFFFFSERISTQKINILTFREPAKICH